MLLPQEIGLELNFKAVSTLMQVSDGPSSTEVDDHPALSLR